MHSVLIPLLSPNQLTTEFILEATKKADNVILLEVIEQESGLTPSELTERMQAMETAVENAKFELQKRGVRTVFFEEWGTWEEKIKSTYKREGLDEVVVPVKSKIVIKGVKIRRV